MKRKTGRICWGILLTVAMAVSCIGMPAQVKAANGDLVFEATQYVCEGAVAENDYVKPVDDETQRSHQNLISIPLTGVASGTYEVKVTYLFVSDVEGKQAYINVMPDGTTEHWKGLDPTETTNPAYSTFVDASVGNLELEKGNSLVVQNGDDWVWISKVTLVPIDVVPENGYRYLAVDYKDAAADIQDSVYVKSDATADGTKLVSIPLTDIEPGYYNISITYKSGQGDTTMPYYQINEGRYNWKQVPASQLNEEWILRKETFGDPSVVYLKPSDILTLGKGGQWYWLRSVSLTKVESVLEQGASTFEWKAVGKQLRTVESTKDIRFVFSLPKDCGYTVTEIGTVASKKGNNKDPKATDESVDEIAVCSGSTVKVTQATKFYSEVNAENTTYSETDRYITTLRLTGVDDAKTYCCRAYAKVQKDGKEYVIYSDMLEASVSDLQQAQ